MHQNKYSADLHWSLLAKKFIRHIGGLSPTICGNFLVYCMNAQIFDYMWMSEFVRGTEVIRSLCVHVHSSHKFYWSEFAVQVCNLLSRLIVARFHALDEKWWLKWGYAWHFYYFEHFERKIWLTESMVSWTAVTLWVYFYHIVLRRSI